MSKLTFEQWLAELRTLIVADEWPEDYPEQTGHDFWLEAYCGGLSPQEAWATELSYAAECLG